MKMSFHLRNRNFLANDKTKRNNIFSIVFVIFVIVIFSFSLSRDMLFKTGTPLWTIKNNINTFFLNNILVLNSKTNLIKENSLLNEKIKLNEKEYALFNLLKKENEDLKNILNRKKDDQKFILGSVLVKPFMSPYDTLIIDVGTSKGVSVGNVVVVDGNTFIGFVSETYSDTSKVVLYSSPGEKVKVLIGDNNIEKEAIGLGGGNFKVEIPTEIDVKEGDLVVIPAISTNIFGVVEKVEFKESDSFQTVLFKTPVNIAELKWVEVLLSNKK